MHILATCDGCYYNKVVVVVAGRRWITLTLKGEASTELFTQALLVFLSFEVGSAAASYLVGGLVELLGVERATKTHGDSLTEEDVVGKGGNAAVVDLDLEDYSC